MLIPNENGYYRNGNSQISSNGKIERVIYPNQSQPHNSLKTALILVLSVFLLGLTVIVLSSVYDALIAYKAQINRLIYCALIVGVIFFLGFIFGLLYLAFESKANQKQLAEPELIEDAEQDDTDSFKELVIATYDNMKEKDCYSQTQLALATFGKKGTHYSNQLREILAEHGREF